MNINNFTMNDVYGICEDQVRSILSTLNFNKITNEFFILALIKINGSDILKNNDQFFNIISSHINTNDTEYTNMCIELLTDEQFEKIFHYLIINKNYYMIEYLVDMLGSEHRYIIISHKDREKFNEYLDIIDLNRRKIINGLK